MNLMLCGCNFTNTVIGSVVSICNLVNRNFIDLLA